MCARARNRRERESLHMNFFSLGKNIQVAVTATGDSHGPAALCCNHNQAHEPPCSVACKCVLQCVAESEHHQAHEPSCPSGCKCVLQRVAACSHVFPCVPMCCRVFPCVAVCCNVLQCVAMCYSELTPSSKSQTHP